MEDLKTPNLHEAIEEMIVAYQELNGAVDEIQGIARFPSDAYAKHVAKNRPFILRNGCANWIAAKRWNADYLREKMEGRCVKIAVTPLGNADSIATRPEDGLQYFVKPLEISEPFSDFLASLQANATNIAASPRAPVKYSQGQNDNLRGEYISLFSDVPTNIPDLSTALGSEPEAINFWLGNSLSTTALHRDNYENVYCQIRGAKNFVLIPPAETACVNEQFLPCAEYDYTEAGGWLVRPNDPDMKVPVPTWDPDKPQENRTAFSRLSRPLRVRLDEGDMLYLPACWYHKVSQADSTEGFSCSVNYWFDMDFDGVFHATNTYIRSTAWAATHKMSCD